MTNGQTDRQTGANLNAPRLSSRGHKNFFGGGGMGGGASVSE